jgi:hypothetical protein
MDARRLVKWMLVVAAYGPSGSETAEDDAGAGESSGGEETGPAPMCLSPQPDGVPAADGALQCVSSDDLSGTLALNRGDWPEVVLDDCAHGRTIASLWPPFGHPYIGEPCQIEDVELPACAAGLACYSKINAPGCTDGNCCVPLCNLDQPAACPDGLMCIPMYHDPTPQANYVGVCLAL